MFLNVHPEDGDSYYLNLDHVLRLRWEDDEWEAQLDVELESGEWKRERWDWETRSYDEDTEEWEETADESVHERWMKTRRQLELFARKQDMEWARVEATIEEMFQEE
jgi:hypothetical protein